MTTCEHAPLSNSNSTQNSTPINDVTNKTPPIGVIGSGNYATALTQRLTSIGFEVVIGSRYPSKRESAMILGGSCLCGVEVTSIERCLNLCDVIFVAIHMEDYNVTLSRYSHSARNKILIDISNRENRYAKISNAQRLANVMPNSSVVKAFNTISPSVLEVSVNSLNSPKVYVASDDKIAKRTVMDLARKMGFCAIDFGELKSALYLEDFVLRVFTRWRIPLFVAVGVFNLWSLYIIYIYFVAKTSFQWEQLFLKVFNKPLCMTAITMVSFTYMPGQIAAILQVYRGTKHQRFPKFLDGWMKCRKQLGLISYFLVIFHVIASTMMMSPTYYRTWFHQPEVTIPANTTLGSNIILPVSTAWMVWKGEAALWFGISAFLVMSVLAVTSIPSVGDTLNWAEWRCVHSNMGTAFMMLSVTHVVVMGAPGWSENGFLSTLQSITFLSIILPSSVLISKIVFYFTPLRCHLKRIRKGWERNAVDTKSSPLPLSQRKGHNSDLAEAIVDMNGILEEIGSDVNGHQEEVGLMLKNNVNRGHCCKAACRPQPTNGLLSDATVPSSNSHCQCSPV